jgi:hypothetical protein
MIKIEIEIPDEVVDLVMEAIAIDPEIGDHELAFLSFPNPAGTLGDAVREAVAPLMR